MTDKSRKLESLLYSWRRLDTPKNELAYSKDQSESHEGEPSTLVGLCLRSISKALVSNSWQKIFSNADIFVCSVYLEQVAPKWMLPSYMVCGFTLIFPRQILIDAVRYNPCSISDLSLIRLVERGSFGGLEVVCLTRCRSISDEGLYNLAELSPSLRELDIRGFGRHRCSRLIFPNTNRSFRLLS